MIIFVQLGNESGECVRRSIWIFFVFVFCCLFFWRDLLSIGLHGVVQWKLKCQIAFRQLSFQEGQLVLEDALLLNCSNQRASFHIHAKKIRISIVHLQKPLHIHIALDEPHITLLEGSVSNAGQWMENRPKWFCADFSVDRGTFEWQGEGNDPFQGRFSLNNEKLQIDVADGSMSAQLIHSGRERMIDCSFDRMPMTPLSHRFVSGECRGRISGALVLNLHRRKIQSAGGRLRWEDAAFSSENGQGEGGAEFIEWEGEHTFVKRADKSWLDAILLFPDRLKIKFHRGFFSRGQSCFDNLEGMFSSNLGVGLRWEVSGPSFSWEGKGFSKSCSTNWLETRLCMHEAKLFLHAEQFDSVHSHSILELEKADPAVVRLLHDLWPTPWPCLFVDGYVSARLIWDECDGSVESWKIEQLTATKLAIQGDDWSLLCDRAEADLDQGGNGAVSLAGSSGRWGKVTVFSMNAHCQINNQSISAGSFSGTINGWEATGDLQGSFKHLLARASHRSSTESIDASADLIWNGKQYDLSQAHLDARHLDLICLQTLFSIHCEGRADATLNYSNGELKLEGAGSMLKLKGGAWAFAVDQLGKAEPFEAGVNAVWKMASRQWTLQTEKTRCECTIHDRKIDFEGHLEITGDLLKISVGKGIFSGLEFAGDWMFALEDNIPFSFTAQRLHGEIEPLVSCAKGHIVCENDGFTLSGDLLSNPALWQWNMKARLSEIQWGLLHDGEANLIADSKDGLIECTNLTGSLALGNARFGICGAELRKCDQEWYFDFRLEHEIWDWGRLSGAAIVKENHLVMGIDSSKSHLLNAPIHVQEALFAMNGSIESMKLSWRLEWEQLMAASSVLEKIDHSFHSLLCAPVQGAGLFEIDFGLERSLIQLRGEDLRWKGEPIPLLIRVNQQKDLWEVERFLLGAIDLNCCLKREEIGWKIEKGFVQWKDRLEASLGGYLQSFSKYELMIDQMKVNLQNFTPSIWPSLEGRLEGKGQLTMEWNGRWEGEADFDLRAFDTKSGSYLIDNAGLIQIHFSTDQGLLIHGLNLEVHKPDLDWPRIHSRIGLVQFDFQRNHWIFHHSQLKLPADSIGALRQKLSDRHPLCFMMQAIDCQHDLEFVADVDCSADFSSLTCSMREGFIPFLGAVRHLQNVNLSWNSSGMYATMSAIQGGHSLKIGSFMEFEPSFWGRIFLEDEEHPLLEDEKPLTIEWGIESDKELMIRSIEGTFGGIEASFHAQSRNCLIGSTRVHFGPLSEILPPRLGKVFHDLKMGKGYELKGHLFYDCQNPSNISFKGLMSGKQCELFGFQIRTLLTQVEIHPSHVHLFELKASDSAGILTIDKLQIQQGPDFEWTMSMPRLKLLEFRPSLLQKTGRDSGRVGPLVVRELKLKDLTGKLEERASFTATGELHFVNSFKREHTVFDLPADLFGRIIGLDSELLVPVRGKFKFELKEGRFWLSDLEDAYSEGKRSKFFLVKEGLSPTIDLDGNLHIFVTMKQYVLFKITENFLLTIDGPIESPSFHLQKKSKLLGLCGY